MKLKQILFAAALFAAPLATSAHAQESGAAAAPRQTISVQPVALIYGVYGLEYERALSASTSAAVSLTHSAWFDTYGLTSLVGKYRYYFNGQALNGFAIGGTVGVLHSGYDADEYCDGDPYCEDEVGGSATVPNFGVDLSYTFQLGDDRKFSITPTLGARRAFSKIAGEDFTLAYPVSGIFLGYAF